MTLEVAFETIYGRGASPEEASRFNRLAKELDIRDNDAVWVLVFLLGHHLELTKRMPEQIKTSAQQVLASFSGTLTEQLAGAESELRLAKARVEENISRAVVSAAEKEIARSAQAVARYTAGKSWLQWIGAAGLVGMAILALAFSWGYSTGQHVGYASALDVKEAEAWVATPAGKVAYQMDRNGDLMHFARCDQDGWKIEKTKSGGRGCFVRPLQDGETIGWIVPTLP